MPHRHAIRGDVDPRFLTPLLAGMMTRIGDFVDWVTRMERSGLMASPKATSAIFRLASDRAEDLMRRDTEANRLQDQLAEFEPDDWENPRAKRLELESSRIYREHIAEIMASWGRSDLAGLYRSGPEVFDHFAQYDFSPLYLPEGR